MTRYPRTKIEKRVFKLEISCVRLYPWALYSKVFIFIYLSRQSAEELSSKEL